MGHYQNCDVSVLPSITDWKQETEGLGMVLLEALACGKPVIGTNTGGIVDIVKHEETGLLVEEKNAKQLAQALNRILSNPGFAKQLAQNGRNHFHAHYSSAGIAANTQRLYEALMPA